MLNRTESPEIKDAVDFEFKLKPYQANSLKNGVNVYEVNAGAQDVFQLEFIFAAGNVNEKKRNVAAVTNSLLKNGTKSKSAFEINEHFEFYGVYCNRACFNENSVISLSGLSKHLAAVLPLVKEMITEASFPEEELAIYKQNAKQRLSVGLRKSDFVASRLIDAYVYGEQHPYGSYTNVEDIEHLTIADLKAYYNTYYLNGSCSVFVSGKAPANTFDLLNDLFGTLPLRNLSYQPTTEPYNSAGEKKHRIINDENGVQGSIRLARPFPNRHHPDFQEALVLNAIFGGYFGSRLMSNIREDKGYTYGIHSYVQNHIGQSAWLISTEAGKDVCEATVSEIYKEMKILREELVDEEELMLVRNYMLGIILGDLDGPFQIMGRWKNILLNDLNESYFYSSIEVIKNITAEQIQKLAQKYLQENDFYELIVI